MYIDANFPLLFTLVFFIFIETDFMANLNQTDITIDDILKDVAKSEIYIAKELSYFKSNHNEYNRYRRILSIKMKDELGLLVKLASNKYVPSEKAREIIDKGGWIVHINSKENKSKKERNKFKYDYYFSKFRYYTYWPFVILALLSSAYSSYDFFKQTPSIEEDVKVLERAIQQLQSETPKQNTSASNRAPFDSLPNPSHPEKTTSPRKPQADTTINKVR